MNEIRHGELLGLPVEVWDQIIEKLDYRDKKAMVRVSKRFSVITVDVAKKEVESWLRFKDFIERNLGEKLFIKNVIVLSNLPAINLINEAFQSIIFSRLFEPKDLRELILLDNLATTEELPQKFRRMIKFCLDHKERQELIIITPDSVTIKVKVGTIKITQEDGISLELKPEYRDDNKKSSSITFDKNFSKK